MQLPVGDIAAGHPYQLRRWPVTGNQLYKVAVFADNDDWAAWKIAASLVSRSPNVRNENASKLNSCRKRRRKLCVNPGFHAASRTISDLRAANCRHSRMSLTRIRIPRMQGCPPHFPGSIVMRSSRLGSWTGLLYRFNSGGLCCASQYKSNSLLAITFA